MINSDQYSVQSAKPLKDFVGDRFDDNYKTDEMQDSEEFVNYLGTIHKQHCTKFWNS